MISSNQAIETSLATLTTLAPPPKQPVFNDCMARLASGYPNECPRDYIHLLKLYGSGYFSCGEQTSVVSLLNPSDPSASEEVDELLSSARDSRAEKREFLPLNVYPESAGVFPWASGVQRKTYFWLTEGSPDDWPIIVWYDMEIVTRFNMATTVFLAQLLGGRLDTRFIGLMRPGPIIDPKTVSFRAFTHAAR